MQELVIHVRSMKEDPESSLILRDFIDLVNSTSSGKTKEEIKTRPDLKCDVLSSVIVVVAINVASSAIYDLLKMAINKHGGHSRIETDFNLEQEWKDIEAILDEHSKEINTDK